MTPTRSGHPVQRLTLPLYAYAFLDECRLIYPLYTLLFADTGLSTSAISSLLVIWAVTGILLEIPSGAWADTVPRRLLLTLAPLLTAAGFTLWTLTPGYWAFAAGFVLWGAQGALQSGALEALVYDELDHHDATLRYPTLIGRVRAVGAAAVLTAMVTAGPLLDVGGYRAVGAATIATCLLTAAAGLLLPETPATPHPQTTTNTGPGYLATLTAGLTEARHHPPVRRALLIAAAVTAIWGALEEYVPLLATETGLSEHTVPLAVLTVWVGVTSGNLLAGTVARLPDRHLAALLTVAAIVLTAGVLSRHPGGFVLVGAAFGLCQLAAVRTETHLQDTITTSSRATVTSVAALATNTVTLAVYGTYAVLATHTHHRWVFAVFALTYLAIAAALHRTRPAPTTSTIDTDHQPTRA